jgi:NAD(P)-dependent dehydrogenase (short-subunit alcohol dehydrogenase family)
MRPKSALVTGASRGIGKAIAIELARLGYDVAVAARTVRKGDPVGDHSLTVHRKNDGPLPGSLEETAAEIRALGREAYPLRMDLTDLQVTEAATRELLDQWGGVEVIVHNGRHLGPGYMDTILDTPIEQYSLFLMAHAVAPLRITQLTLPAMLEAGRGTVLTITSGEGDDWIYPLNPPGQAGVGLGYRLGKMAGHTIAGTIRVEYGDRGVRAFNVNPGAVMTERVSLDLRDSAGFAAVATYAPPSVVGAAVAWLVTDPEADGMQRATVHAQELALERGLHPDWRKTKV